MVSQGCLSLIKYFLFLFNLFFFTLGLLLLSLGLWIVFDEVSFFMPPPSFLSLSVLSYFLAIGGTVTMAVGFFGCMGALKEIRCMLGMYFFLLTVLLAAQIVGGVIFFTQKTAFEDKVKEHVLQIITSFRKNNSSLNHFENTLEYIQREVNCCGWNGPTDWGDDMVPCSCYQLPNNTVLEHLNQGMNNGSQKLCPCHSTFFPQNNTCNIYKQGCREGIKRWLEENMVIILGVLFAVVLVEFIQFIGLTMFYCLSHCHHCCHQPLKTNDRLFQPSRDFYMEYWQGRLFIEPFNLCGMVLSMSLYRKMNLDYSALTRYS